MNILKSSIILVFSCVALSSCTANFGTKEEVSHADSAFAYQCPMHCEGSGSDSAGICPVCNMDYVKVKN